MAGKEIKKRKRYKKFKDMTRPQQIKLVRSLTIVGILFVSLMVLIAVFMIKKVSSFKASSESEGDIFSRGYDIDKDQTIIIEQVPPEIQESIDKAREENENTDINTVYESMKRENPDFAGYLKIEGTQIDYPVMYTPDDPEKYLDKDINAAKSIRGLPFIDARCRLDPRSDNIIIYAHHMKDGSMFGNLDKYNTREYYNEHPVIDFDTIGESGRYDVVYAFYDRVYYEDEKDFKFYDFLDAKDESDFDMTMKAFTEKAIYDTGITPEYGDKFITLVTCSYQEEEGRFVVIAKKQ